MNDDLFILFQFPDYQEFMELEGYKENTVVPCPLEWSEEFNSTVMIRKSWLDSLDYDKIHKN